MLYVWMRTAGALWPHSHVCFPLCLSHSLFSLLPKLFLSLSLGSQHYQSRCLQWSTFLDFKRQHVDWYETPQKTVTTLPSLGSEVCLPTSHSAACYLFLGHLIYSGLNWERTRRKAKRKGTFCILLLLLLSPHSLHHPDLPWLLSGLASFTAIC